MTLWGAVVVRFVIYTFLYTHASSHVCSPSRFYLWLFLSHCLLIELMGSPQLSFLAHSVLWTLFVTIFLSCIVTALVCLFVFSLCHMSVQPHWPSLFWGSVQWTRLCDIALFHRFFVLSLCHMSVQTQLTTPLWGSIQCTRLCDIALFYSTLLELGTAFLLRLLFVCLYWHRLLLFFSVFFFLFIFYYYFLNLFFFFFASCFLCVILPTPTVVLGPKGGEEFYQHYPY